MRAGFGYDVHAFEPGDSLILGGIKIPFNRKFKAHSDGDVLIHSLCDAILGAAALGDIGKHFPDNDPKYINISSLKLLEKSIYMLENEGFEIINMDITVVLQKPKIQEYIPAMRKKISEHSGVNIGRISVKATTSEKLGFTGEEKGAESYALVMIK